MASVSDHSSVTQWFFFIVKDPYCWNLWTLANESQLLASRGHVKPVTCTWTFSSVWISLALTPILVSWREWLEVYVPEIHRDTSLRDYRPQILICQYFTISQTSSAHLRWGMSQNEECFGQKRKRPDSNLTNTGFHQCNIAGSDPEQV